MFIRPIVHECISMNAYPIYTSICMYTIHLHIYHICMYIYSYVPIYLCLFIHLNLYQYIALPTASPWCSLLTLLFFATIVSTFVSHTVAAIILLPIVTTVGVSLGMPEVVVISCAFAGKCVIIVVYMVYCVYGD